MREAATVRLAVKRQWRTLAVTVTATVSETVVTVTVTVKVEVIRRVLVAWIVTVTETDIGNNIYGASDSGIDR